VLSCRSNIVPYSRPRARVFSSGHVMKQQTTATLDGEGGGITYRTSDVFLGHPLGAHITLGSNIAARHICCIETASAGHRQPRPFPFAPNTVEALGRAVGVLQWGRYRNMDCCAREEPCY